MGARVFLRGRQNRELPPRRPHADIAELRAQGFLRRVATETGNEIYALTPAAHEKVDQLARPKSAAAKPPKQRPSEPHEIFSAAPSTCARLLGFAERCRTALESLTEVSEIRLRHERGSGVITAHPWQWAPLHPPALSRLGVARQALNTWLADSRRFLSVVAPEQVSEFDEAAEVLVSTVDRSAASDGPPAETSDRVAQYIHEALDRQIAILKSVPAWHESSELMVVADTNALIDDPALEPWVLPEPATIVVPPQVVSELDGKKHDAVLGAKATSLIKRFNEYDRRGDTLAGVPLVGRRRFRELALHGDVAAVPGLDPNHGDDRILATIIELAQLHPSSSVVLVTRDRNMRNKARYFGVPAVDVVEI